MCLEVVRRGNDTKIFLISVLVLGVGINGREKSREEYEMTAVKLKPLGVDGSLIIPSLIAGVSYRSTQKMIEVLEVWKYGNEGTGTFDQKDASLIKDQDFRKSSRKLRIWWCAHLLKTFSVS